MAINYSQNKKYFETPSLKPGVALVLIGLLLLAGGASGGSGGVVFVGLLGMAGGVALLASQLGGRPSDAQIDASIDEGMRDLQRRAINKLGLDEDEVKLIDPIVVGGPYFTSLGSPARVKRGKDGVVRSSNHEGVVIYFSEHQLHAYKYQFSIIDSNERREQTDEYFYRDVVSIATQSESERVGFNGRLENVNYEVLKLTTSGGTSIVSAMRDSGDTVTRSIQGARQLIRDRKIAG